MSTPFERCDECDQIVVDKPNHMQKAHDQVAEQCLCTCQYCGDEFRRNRTDQQYCSQSCANRGRHTEASA